VEKKLKFAEQNGLDFQNETLKKTALMNFFRLQTYHRTSSITKYTSKASIAFVVTCLSVCSNRGLEKTWAISIMYHYRYHGT